MAAERLTASYQQIPHIHISMDVSAVWLQQFRTGYQLEGKKNLLQRFDRQSHGPHPK